MPPRPSNVCREGHPKPLGGRCKVCAKRYARAYFAKNRQKYTERERSRYRRATLGVTDDMVDAMLEAQGNACKICGRIQSSRALNVDHCHSTGQVRGMLCGPCNTGIGLIKTPDLLRKAAEYLEEKHNEQSRDHG